MDYLSRKLSQLAKEHEQQYRNGSMHCSICGAPAIGQNTHTLEYFCSNPEHEHQVWEHYEQSDR